MFLRKNLNNCEFMLYVGMGEHISNEQTVPIKRKCHFWAEVLLFFILEAYVVGQREMGTKLRIYNTRLG